MCFILTMWYVNSVIADNKFSESPCFILTMWYVNSNEIESETEWEESFILTMWYVNRFTIIGKLADPDAFYINYVVCKFVKYS